jgi:hypothetical protein
MGEGFKRKVGKAFRHRAEALCEQQFKERTLFSEQPEVRRTHYRFRWTDPNLSACAGLAVVLSDEGQAALAVWCGNRRVGEMDAASSANLRRAFGAEPRAGHSVDAVIQSQPSLSGYCQAIIQSAP